MTGSATYPFLTLLIGIPLFLMILERVRSRGFSEGWWLPWMCVLLLVPCWLWTGLGSLRFDVRTAAALGIAVAFLLQPWQSVTRNPWVWADAWMLGILGSHCLTDFSTDNLTPLTPLEHLRDFGLPYLVGRLCLRSPEDLRRMLPSVILPAVILSAYAIFESFAQVNLVNRLIGQRWELLESGEGFRWGLKRAQGNLNHPIYLGMLIVLILPWLIEAYHEAKAGRGPSWWRYVPALAIIAMIGTVSRAAQIATLMTVGADVIFRNPRWRGTLLTGAVILGCLAVVFRDDLLDSLSSLAGEARNETVKINGVDYDYTGTAHRDLLSLVYQEAAESVKPLGYGTMLEGMPVDNQRDERFRSIDDHYLLYYLRYGPFGMFFFVGFAACIGICLLREAWAFDTPHAGFCGCVFGAFLGTTLIVKGVAMEADFGWMWLFAAGVAGRLRAFRLERRERDYLRPGV